MSLGNTPAVVHLDPDGGAAADLWVRLLAVEPRPRPILVMADVRARRSGWGPRAIMALGDALAQRLTSVTVIDLEFEDPQLHRLAGVRNDEGIGDALLFGASIDHLAQLGPGHRARVVPAGALIPSPGELLASPGWTRVLEEATAAGGGLLLYVPLETHLGPLAQHFDRAIHLRGDASAVAPAPAGAVRTLAILTPPATAVPQPDVHGDRERAALIADLRVRQTAALAATGRGGAGEPPRPVMAGTPAAVEREARIVLGEPPAAEKLPPPPPSNRRGVVLGLVAVLLISLLYGVWHYVGRDYLARRREASRQAAGAGAPPAAVPAPAGEPLPYSVAIEAHPDLRTAAARADALAAAQPSMGFYIAPILVDTDVYYRVMAGPVRDSATAASVMDTLVARREKTGSSEYDIRSTPLTFLLGEFATRDEAARRMNELRQLDIPSYIVEMPYTVGPPRHRLYSGAYSGPAEADVMRQLLQATGLADSLVLRTGRPSS